MNHLKHLFFPVVILFLSCQPPLPDDAAPVLTDWFVNGNKAAKKELSQYRLDPEKLTAFGDSLRAGTIQRGKRFCVLRDADGTEHTLGFSTPARIIKDSLYPLLVYLHGGIGTNKKDKGKFAYDMFTFLTDTIDMFIASPSGNKTALWWNERGINRILQSLRYMVLNFPIDPDRIILAGVSDGAAGCYVAANTFSSPFAGFIPISGFGGILPQLGIMLNPTNLVQRPIYNINGAKDTHYTGELVQKFLDWMAENDVIIKSKIYPGQGHGFDYKLQEKTTLVELITTWRKPASKNIYWTLVPDIPNLADNLLSCKVAGKRDNLHIATRWAGDTLVVNSSGITSFSMITDRPVSKGLYYRTGNGKAQPLTFLKQSTALQLDLMKHTCIPGYIEKNVITITLHR